MEKLIVSKKEAEKSMNEKKPIDVYLKSSEEVIKVVFIKEYEFKGEKYLLSRGRDFHLFTSKEEIEEVIDKDVVDPIVDMFIDEVDERVRVKPRKTTLWEKCDELIKEEKYSEVASELKKKVSEGFDDLDFILDIILTLLEKKVERKYITSLVSLVKVIVKELNWGNEDKIAYTSSMTMQEKYYEETIILDEAFLKLCECSFDHEGVHFELAKCYFETKQYDKAAKEFAESCSDEDYWPEANKYLEQIEKLKR